MNHYQVNLRSIANSNPRNPLEALREAKAENTSSASPLRVLTEELELIQELGVGLLHLMPPFRMGQEARKGIGSPYAVADYLEIDPEFGSKAEWFDLVRKAHRLGMRIILGFMPNHTARDHVWISEDPENYLRQENGEPGYDFDWSDTAKLNYAHPPLRRKVLDTLQYWLRGEDEESGVDGYRMDMAHMINDLSFWNEVIPQLEPTVTHPLLLLAECYGMERNLDLFHRGFHAAYDDDFYKIAQYAYARDAKGNSRLLLDPEAAHNADFAPRLRAWEQGGIAGAVRQLLETYQAQAPDKLLARYVDNHDEGRGNHRFGPQAARVMLDLAACMPQTILFTLAGQEAGALNRPPIHEYFSLCDKGYRRIENGELRSIEGIEFEGNLFFRTSEERQEAISESRKRFALHADPVIREGACHWLEVQEEAAPADKTVAAFSRSLNGSTLHCLFNLGHEDRKLHQIPEGELIHGELHNQTLPAFGSLVIKSKA